MSAHTEVSKDHAADLDQARSIHNGGNAASSVMLRRSGTDDWLGAIAAMKAGLIGHVAGRFLLVAAPQEPAA